MLAIHAQGNRLISGSGDKSIRVRRTYFCAIVNTNGNKHFLLTHFNMGGGLNFMAGFNIFLTSVGIFYTV